MNEKKKEKLVDLCKKIVPIGAKGLADDLEEIIDKNKQPQGNVRIFYAKRRKK